MSTLDRRPTMFFWRHFTGLSGGHLKVRHYFEHVRVSGRYDPSVFFAPGSVLDGENPWSADRSRVLLHWEPTLADALFLGGLDWEAVPDDLDVPVLNLIQNVRHAFPDDPRYPFLRRRAFRVCVSEDVADAIRATRAVNGPIVTIPLGIDVPTPVSGVNNLMEDASPSDRRVDVLVAGAKNPEVARAVGSTLEQRGLQVDVLTAALPRAMFLARLTSSRTVVALPLPAEGFFLPAAEALAAGCTVVLPRVPGTGEYVDEVHALRPEYRVESIVDAALRALQLDPDSVAAMRIAAARFIEAHSLARERQLTLDALEAFSGDW